MSDLDAIVAAVSAGGFVAGIAVGAKVQLYKGVYVYIYNYNIICYMYA